MNTNGLAKLYDRLTPKERLPLIMAASARGDDAERHRLTHSAPTAAYQLPDYYGQAEGMQLVSLFHLLELLEAAAGY